MQTRDEQKPLTGLVTADEPGLAPTIFDAARAQGRFEPQLQATLNLIAAHTWYANASGALTFVNERLADYLGLPKDHPLRSGIATGAAWDSHLHFVHPDEHEEARKVWSTCLRTGRAGDFSFRVRTIEGGYRWFLSRAEPVRSSDGTLLYWIGVNLDIEERKQVDLYLAEGQRLAHMGSWAFNAAGFDYWSPELFRIHGLDPGGKVPTVEEYMGLVHPEDREFVAGTIQKMFAEGRGFDFTKRIVRPDREIRSVRCVGVPSTHGSCQGFVGTAIDVTEQERILGELKRSEYYLAEGQRLAHAGSWSFKPDLTCDYWSRELYEILGFDPKNGIPTISDYFTRVHPADRAVVEATIQGMIAAGEGCDLKKRIIRPDGVQRVIRCVGMPVRENGIVTRFVGTLMDITEQEELTQELRRREAFLAEAERLSHTGSCAWNVVTGEQTWSEENYRILGYDRSIKPALELIRDRVHPDDLQLWQQTITQAAEGKRIDFESRLLLPDGSVKHVHVVADGVKKDGKLVEVIGTARDITERKRAEEAIRRSEAYLAEAQRLSHTGSTAHDPATGKIHYWSQESYRIWGFDPQQPPPDSSILVEMIHPEDRDRAYEQYLNSVREGKDYDQEYRIVRSDGAVRHVHVVGHPVFSAGRELIDYISTQMDITERKSAEEELRRSEAYLAEAQKLSQTGSWAWSPDQDIRYWSEECYRILSFNPQDGLPRFEEFFQRIHPDDQPGFRELIQTAIREKAEWEADYRIVHPGGAVRDIHVVGHPVFSPSGDLIEFTGTVIDITERKRAEEELRASEAKYRHLVDTTPAFVHTALPSGDLDFFNSGWLEYLGLSITDLLGWRWTAAIHPEDVEEFLNKWRASLESGQPFFAESRVRRADGEYRWFLHRKQPQRNEAGEIVKWYGSSIEIEERKIAEEAIRRGEAFLAEGQRLSHTGSWGWNASTGKLTWSQEHFRILGLDPQATNPSLDVFWERVHPDDRTGLRRTFESAIRDKRDFEQEFRIVTPDGSIRHLHGVGHAILNKANELVEFIGSTMDITERKRAEAALQEARAELERVTRVTTMGELAASIAHEINQPLAGVVTSANAGLNWLAANPPNLSKTRESLERILRDGTRGGQVLARIRALLKRTPPAKTLVSVNQIVRDVLALTAGELCQHSIELSLELATTAPAVLGDTVQLQQVLLNLIKNAVEAMTGIVNGQRTLRIQSRVGELDGKPAVVVEMSDTGVGLGGTETTGLFEAFHTTKPQGMGMGLWISRSIIENHAGRLTASSNHGPGATFVIMLPTENQGPA